MVKDKVKNFHTGTGYSVNIVDRKALQNFTIE